MTVFAQDSFMNVGSKMVQLTMKTLRRISEVVQLTANLLTNNLLGIVDHEFDRYKWPY